MLQFENQKIKHLVRRALPILVLAALLYSCASIGSPKGGPEDITPPRFVSSTPVAGAVNAKKSKVSLMFDEIIKLEKATEKVVVSPPQIQQPEIKAAGKKIQVTLLDSLKENTTYTIDFSDAIVDNNEGNPLGNFAFTFSTGGQIDTMEVSGTVLEASNLEPIKGMLVGLHSNLNDSAFTKLPFDRVARTDSRGRFSIRGIAPGKYRIYGLMDADQNFMFNQKSEVIAFNDSLIVPTMEERTRMDTAWVDTLTYDTIVERRYTHYLPDDIILRAFKELNPSQYLVKSERLVPHKFTFYFANKADTLPVLKGLNFDEREAFMIEKTQRNDTIHYWVKDSLLYAQDTLAFSLTYLYTDTLNRLVPRTDTLRLVSKQKLTKEEPEKKKKKKKKDDEEEEVEPTKFLPLKVDAPSSMDVYGYISLTFEEPIAHYDSTMIHLKQKVDTLWQDVPFVFERDSVNLKKFNVYYDWEPTKEYEFSVDSTAFHGIYGLFTDKIKQGFKVRDENEYFTLNFVVTGAAPQSFVELLDAQDKVVRRRRVVSGVADFYYLNPGKYTARLIEDANGNGVWDTGDYAKGIQPEKVYYYPVLQDYKALWDLDQSWDIHATPLDKQKLDELKKQKPDEDKKDKNKKEMLKTVAGNLRRSAAIGLLLLLTGSVSLPANAQCEAKNDAFKSGEHVMYDLYFNWKFVWVKAGIASLTTNATTYHSKPAYRINLLALGSKRADFFFKMRDTLTCVVGERLEPRYFRKGAEEGKRYSVDEAWFSYEDGLCLAKQKRTFPRTGEVYEDEADDSRCIYDMLSILAQARSYDPDDYKVGDKIKFAMATGRRVEEQTLIYRGKENVTAENDVTYRCLVFSLVEYNKKGKEKEVITFFISDDKNHLPVRLDLYLNFGSAKAFLNDVTGARHPMTSIVSKKK